MSVFTNPASRSKEDASAYTNAILGLLGDHNPIDVLQRTEGEIRRAIDGLTAQQLRTLEAPKKWSIAGVIQHLADSEVVWAWRLRLVLAQERPPITGYDQDLWAERLRYGDADPEQALREFGVLRGGNLRLVKRATPADLQRVGVHAERGEESVAHMMKMYAGHDLLHLNQIARVRDSLR
jgi:DinB superfamily